MVELHPVVDDPRLSLPKNCARERKRWRNGVNQSVQIVRETIMTVSEEREKQKENDVLRGKRKRMVTQSDREILMTMLQTR